MVDYSQIVLLNLLIALMGSIYEDERENSANHRRAERASMLLEVRNSWQSPFTSRTQRTHPFLHLECRESESVAVHM